MTPTPDTLRGAVDIPLAAIRIPGRPADTVDRSRDRVSPIQLAPAPAPVRPEPAPKAPTGRAKATPRASEPRRGRPRNPLTPDDARHGTRNAYSNYGCHCEPCVVAGKAYDRAGYVRRSAGGQA